jgi:16S rRNA (guanine527-N7)-methyltransferase
MLDTLQRICRELDIEIDKATIERLDAFRTLLLDYNQHTNLTAIRDPLDVEIRLLADSLALLPLIQAEMLREGRDALTLVDLGSGAGFPGLPLAIASPAIQVTLIEATRKKVDFIAHAAKQLNLGNVVPIHARSEDAARDQGRRERYDIVTARALAAMPALVELALPFLRVGGVALLTKGKSIDDEIASARFALDELGGDLYDVWRPGPLELENTTIVQIRKYKPTPAKYPRPAGVPAKQPLLK